MPRYINSADALNTLKHLSYETALNQHDPYVADVFEDIAKNRLETWVDLIPTADVVERKRGHWIRKSPTAWMWTCSCCKKDDAYAYSAGESFEPDVLQDLFCPNCGADMRGEEDE